MNSMTPDFSVLYLMSLNGGAPLTDWEEVKSWAESLLHAEGEE